MQETKDVVLNKLENKQGKRSKKIFLKNEKNKLMKDKDSFADKNSKIEVECIEKMNNILIQDRINIDKKVLECYYNICEYYNVDISIVYEIFYEI